MIESLVFPGLRRGSYGTHSRRGSGEGKKEKELDERAIQRNELKAWTGREPCSCGGEEEEEVREQQEKRQLHSLLHFHIRCLQLTQF